MPRPALFLDRDGVINADFGYVHRIDQVTFVPGIFDLARFAVRKLGWPIVVITNQAGIGRGYFAEAEFHALMAWMCERFAGQGAPISRVYHCPYHPKDGIGHYRLDHPWRKPKPGMILQAAIDLDVALTESALVGDTMSDIEAGAAAGVGLLIRLAEESAEPPSAGPAHKVVPSLDLAITVLQSWKSARTRR